MKSVPWSLAAKLLVRDWRSGEILALLAALIVAVSAMSTVTFFTDRVRQAVERQAGESLAADLRLASGNELPATYFDAAKRFGLETARIIAFRTVVLAGDASTLADVRAVSADYPLRGSVRIADKLAGQPHDAAGVPGSGEVWAEPGLLARLGASVGDFLVVGTARQKITRTLEFRPDEGWRFVQLAPTVLLNLDDLAATELLQPGSVARYIGLFAGDAPALARFRTWLEPRLQGGQTLEDIRDARPEVQRSVSRASRFLMLAALVSVLLGGVAIAMAARRFVTRRFDAVALMKCLGARHKDVLRLAIGQLVILLVVAAVVGTLVGLLAQLGLAAVLKGLIGETLPGASPAGAVLGPVTALVIAVGFALPPLLQLGKVPPARVLRHDLEPPPLRNITIYGVAILAVSCLLYGLFGDMVLLGYLLGGMLATLGALYGAGRLLVLVLGRARGRVGVAWRYGIANIARRGHESAVQLVAFGVGIMVLLLLTVVRDQLMSAWQATLPPDVPNHFIINIQPDQRDALGALLAEQGFAKPLFTPLVRARIVRINGQPVTDFQTGEGRARRELDESLNLSWTSELAKGNRVVEGKWWGEDATEPQLSVEQERLDMLGLALGDEVTFLIGGEPLSFRITNTRAVQWDSFRPNFFMVVNPGAVEEAAHTFVTSFRVPPNERGVTVALMRTFPNISVLDIGAILDQVRGAMARASLAVQYVFLFTVAAGIVVLLAAIQATRDERVLESAVLRALGARRSVVLQGVAAEFVVLGLLAGLLGAAGAGVVGHFIASRLFDLEYLPGVGLWVSGLVGGAVVVGLAGTLAVHRIVRAPPLPSLRGA